MLLAIPFSLVLVRVYCQCKLAGLIVGSGIFTNVQSEFPVHSPTRSSFIMNFKLSQQAGKDVLTQKDIVLPS